MGMTIEEHIAQLKKLKPFHNGSYGASINFAIETIRKYQKLQSDYENRLKADLKAILVELQLEIEEIKPLEPTDDEDWQYGCFHGLELMQDKCLKLIQQKISSLKEA